MSEQTRNVALTLAVIGIMLSATASSAGYPPEVRLAGGGLAFALVIAQWGKIPMGIRMMGGLMVAVAAVILCFDPEPVLTIERGLRSTISFLSLVAAVSLLGARSEASPSVNGIGITLARTAQAGAYAPIAIISHLVASGLSLAGTAVLMASAAQALPPGRDDVAQKLAFSALLRGFCCAICWTPMMGNMALLLAIYDLPWLSVLPINMSATATLIAGGILFEWLRRGRTRAGKLPPELWGVLLKVVLALAVNVPVLVIISRAIDLPIAGIIILLAAPAAMLWAWIERHPAPGGPPRQVGRDAVRRFPGFAGEALLFLGAGLSSAAIAVVVPEDVVRLAGQLLLGSPGLFFLFCLLSIGGLALIGIHPALPALLIATVLSPDAIGLSAKAHFASLLSAWGLANTLGPFTISGLMTARASGRTPQRVTVGWNLGMVLFTAPIGAVALEILLRLFG
ncbi:hypothetical protein ATO6_06205 [Oceanicola sp. 22II-s10i]|uniref:hypothetical protein n=1 Tax=Oceanicola sp. 22II-s10i TaxID=1317116 RepID=UPI000B51F143|nr:hypothetical protein [Oceanicola sp. 22II-s10i]OWU86405.1 hypothetical protein ATO6_06205 [Oceanicola sp. 22II-s10i]